MNDLDVPDWMIALVSALAAVFLSWFLTELSSISAKRRVQQERSATMLFYLIQLWLLLRAAIFRIVTKRVLPQEIQEYVKDLLPVVATKLSENYEVALSEIARDDPILASNLLFRNQFLETSRTLEKVFDESLRGDTDIMIDEVQLIRKGIGFTERSILRVAKRHGIFTWFRVRSFLKRMKKKTSTNEPEVSSPDSSGKILNEEKASEAKMPDLTNK